METQPKQSLMDAIYDRYSDIATDQQIFSCSLTSSFFIKMNDTQQQQQQHQQSQQQQQQQQQQSTLNDVHSSASCASSSSSESQSSAESSSPGTTVVPDDVVMACNSPAAAPTSTTITTQTTPIPTTTTTTHTGTSNNNLVEFYIPSYSPRKTESGFMLASCSLVMTDQRISHVGDCDELERSCQNVLELDLSKNDITSWNEVKKLLANLKRLRLLNLSHNPLLSSSHHHSNDIDMNSQDESTTATTTTDEEEVDEEEEEEDEDEEEAVNVQPLLEYFDVEWAHYAQLRILILNACYVDMRLVECMLEHLDALNELHLSSNDYERVTFSERLCKHSLHILYINNNRLSEWHDMTRLGTCFPSLRDLVISYNDIAQFEAAPQSCCFFPELQVLTMNRLKLDDWRSIECMREAFPQLRHVRIHQQPFLDAYDDEERYFLLVANLADSVQSLNGSEISRDERENCERKFIRYYMDRASKPRRYYELEKKHGKLNRLAEVNFEGARYVSVRIRFRDEPYRYERVDVRQTVGEFKKQMEKLVGYPASRLRVFYIDAEACAMSVYGPEEWKCNTNRYLYSFNVRDGDEFQLDLKHVDTTMPSSSSSSSSSKPILRNRKTSENSALGGGDLVNTVRLNKKTRTLINNNKTKLKKELETQQQNLQQPQQKVEEQIKEETSTVSQSA